MYISKSNFKTKSGKIYNSILLRESYRENGVVKKRTVANISKCSPKEIQAIELALSHKNDLTDLGSFSQSVKVEEGLSFGSVYVLKEIAERLGIIEALGNDHNGKLALWQIFARILEQGSRLSAVRLAKTYALTDVLGIEKAFTEDDLYKNLTWLADNQTAIEDTLYKNQKEEPMLFLYDVTSSYLEGEHNALANYGYNRDGKKGKKQIVIGLLSNSKGRPLSIQVFKGNTQDVVTFSSQIEKAKKRFNCKKVVFVGDRGMIKSGQIDDLSEHGFHYVTAITKPQIETLVKRGVIQYELFDENVCEIKEDDIRYILKRNPYRAQEIADNRDSKKRCIENLIKEQNLYLFEHAKAKIETALKKVESKIKQLKLHTWISVKIQDQKLQLFINEEALKEEIILDGCYVIKTNLSQEEADTQTVHDRYKDLALVESTFRTCKSNLELRPIYVRSEKSTYGHALVVMLSYIIIKELDEKWAHLYLTVEEGLRSLSTLTMQEITLKDKYTYQQVPNPRLENKKMLEALNVEFPKIVPKKDINVVTRISRRKSALKN